MKVIVKGQGEINLTQKEFVASGGEGEVYAKGHTAYKIYHDPTHMLPVGKITELSGLSDPGIIKPEVVLLDVHKSTPVGYTMRFIKDALPLCQIFTRAFREREGLDHNQMLKLIQRLQTLVEVTHKAGVLIVDLNEMNYLTNKVFDDIYAIDVDSYQTKSYPATAIMPSVRDWTVKGNDFTEGSDWFSFACVSYQMFTGIHPYKGKHPSIQGMEDRMKAGVSVFDPSVLLPKVVYPMDVIPQGYKAWFKAVLQDGKRLAPPTDPGSFIAAAIVTRIVSSGAVLDIEEIRTFTDALQGYQEQSGSFVAWMKSGAWLNGHPVLGKTQIKAVGFSPKMGHVVIAWIENGLLSLFDATTQETLSLSLRADDVIGHEGKLHVRGGDRITEIILNDVGGKVIPTPKVIANVLELATRIYPGVVIQNLLGSAFVSVLPSSGGAHQIRVPELEQYKIINARFENRMLMVIGARKGIYDRLCFVFDAAYSSYQMLPPIKDITPGGLNFIVLENGICVHLTEEEKLEIRNVAAPDKVRVIEDKVLGNDMSLVKINGRVGFVRGAKVFTMRIK